MNIKVGNEYLDFNADVEIERQIKLFEEAATTNGDFSYDFTIQATAKNRSIFELYSIDQGIKTIYSKIPSIIESSSGTPIYFGFIRVEKDRTNEIDCSFFSGNSNWFNDLDFDIRDFDFSQYDVDWDKTNIIAKEPATTGIIFPVIDTGALSKRSHVNWHIDDFHPFVYVKSVIQTLLNKSGIKLQGDILQDWRYNHLITSNAQAAAPQDELKDRSVFVNKSTTQNIPSEAIPTLHVITFGNTNGIYYPGSLWNTGTNEFTADVNMLVDVQLTINAECLVNGRLRIPIIINGVDSNKYLFIIFDNFGGGPETKSTSVKRIPLIAGDVLTVDGTFTVFPGGGADIYSATLTITPKRLYKAFTNYLLPDVKAKDFVSETFSLFNTAVDYNGLTKVLTVDLFKNTIRKDEIDISEYLNPSTIEHDYAELMANYGLQNIFRYSECDEENSNIYNRGSVYPFGSGVLDSENELTEPEAILIDSLFIAAMESPDNPFSTFLPRVEWRSTSDSTPSEEGVTADNSGSGATLAFLLDGFIVGDMVRIENSTVDGYNGEWIVSAISTGVHFRVSGLTYMGNATVDVTKLVIEFEDKDEQALLLAIPNYSLSNFTNVSLMYYADTSSVSGVSSPATAYFYKPLQGFDVDEYKESLSFGVVNIENAHQVTMLESYWRDFGNILKDPVKTFAKAFFPQVIFDRLFSGPLRIKTSKFNCRFFMNRVTGYKSSSKPCMTELIKL